MDFSTVLEIIKGIPGKIKGVPGKIKAFFSAFFSALRVFKLPKVKFQKPDFSELWDKIKGLIGTALDFINSQLDRLPEEKRKPFLIGFGGLGGIVLIMLIVIIVKPGRGANSTSVAAMGFVIPQEELFLPSEPDFVPEFLLEREPRRAWQLEDIRPYWKPPEIGGFWREKIKSAVDELMEGVP